ncbi:hypothetical protein PRVXT_000681 [Proteinivorax tanatarense]|uniref:Uncharacterized protein n=1 Tax=Proteinivorax tanatarense TaxID=1260629 RepID=A0AAU7VN34_9FIRM
MYVESQQIWKLWVIFAALLILLLLTLFQLLTKFRTSGSLNKSFIEENIMYISAGLFTVVVAFFYGGRIKEVLSLNHSSLAYQIEYMKETLGLGYFATFGGLSLQFNATSIVMFTFIIFLLAIFHRECKKAVKGGEKR